MACKSVGQTRTRHGTEMDLLEEYVLYWKDRYLNHPLYHGLKEEKAYEYAHKVLPHTDLRDGCFAWHDKENNITQWDLKFDWERCVMIMDAVYKYLEKGKLPSNKEPRKMQFIRVGRNRQFTIVRPYTTVYFGKHADADENDIFYESFDVTGYDKRTHYKFTVGNFEAAFRITDHIWRPRLRLNKKAAVNYREIIWPICHEFLTTMQGELDGYNRDIVKEVFPDDEDRVSAQKVLTTKENKQHDINVAVQEYVLLESVRERREDAVIELIIPTTVEDDKVYMNLSAETRFDGDGVVVRAMDDVEKAFALKDCHPIQEPAGVDRLCKQVRMDLDTRKAIKCYFSHLEKDSKKRNFDRKSEGPFRWYPKIDREQLKKNFRVAAEQEGMYWENLFRVYMRIGRPDLAMRYLSPSARNWTARKWEGLFGHVSCNSPVHYVTLDEFGRPKTDWMKRHFGETVSADLVSKVVNTYQNKRDPEDKIVRTSHIVERILENKVAVSEDNLGSDPSAHLDPLNLSDGEDEEQLQDITNIPDRVDEEEPVDDWDADDFMHVVPQGKCITGKHRDKALRILSQWTILLYKHRDKMEVLSHRGRFSYLTQWDIALFNARKRAIVAMDLNTLNDLIALYGEFVVAVNDIIIPRSYVEQADCIITLCECANRTQKPADVYEAMRSIKSLVSDWENAEFDPKRTYCWRPQGDSANSKVGAAAGGKPSNTAAPEAPKKMEKPITSGEKKVNITMVDQRAKETDTVPDLKKGKKHTESNQEAYYQLLDMLKRPMFIQRIQWDTTQALNTVLGSWILPHTYFSSADTKASVCQDLTASYVLAMFGAARFDMKVRIQINSIKFQQGRLAFVFRPFYDYGRRQDVLNNLPQYPHVFIDASVSNTVELTIPWTNFRDAFPIYVDPHSEFNYFGTVEAVVWNPLMVGANGSTDTSVSMWMWLEETQVYQLTNPKNAGHVAFASNVLGNSAKNDLVEDIELVKGFARIVQTSEWEPQAQIMEGVLEAGVGVVKDVGADLVEHLLDRVSRGSNSKPGTVLPPQPVLPIVMPNSAWADGVDLSTRLSLAPLSVTKSNEDAFRCVNLKELLKQWSRIKIVEWKTTDSENVSLWKWGVQPMQAVGLDYWYKGEVSSYSSTFDGTDVCKMQEESTTASVFRRAPSILDYIARSFFYWRGSLKWRIELVCTTMHSGRLLLRYEPLGTDSSTKFECQKLATPGIVWDVQEQHELIFETPYMSTQPLLTAQQIGGGVISTDVTSSANGMCEITVVNRLKVTTGISSTVQVNVYVAAGDDFEYAMLSPLNGIVSLRKTPFTPYGATGQNDLEIFLLQRWCWEYLAAPGFLEWEGVTKTTETVAGVKYDIYTAKEPYLSGPFINRPKTPVTLNYAGFISNISEILKHIDTKFKVRVGGFEPPRFTTIEGAFNFWARYDVSQVPYGRPGYTMGYRSQQKVRFWLSVALLREHAWQLSHFPHVKGDENWTSKWYVKQASEDVHSMEWKAQSNSKAVGPSINPFNSFKPPAQSVKDMYGEDFMDMYRIMKRWQQWMTNSTPPRLGTDMVANAAKAHDYQDLVRGVVTIQEHEQEQYYAITKIPITPFHPHSKLGDSGTYWATATDWSEIQTGGSTWLSKRAAGAGLPATLTSARFFGELFTFWRGSMRYRIQPFSTHDDNGKPWWAMVVYHPQDFRDFSSVWKPDIIHQHQLADLTRMGSVLFEGNVMGSVDVEVPYYSKYSRLYVSDEIFADYTMNGSLYIIVPIRKNAIYGCADSTDNWVSTGEKLVLQGFRYSLWTAVGDDFEYSVPRSAPYQFLWPEYVNRPINPKMTDNGWDRLMLGKTVPRDGFIGIGDVKKEVQDTPNLKNVTQHPIKSTTLMKFIKKDLSMEKSPDEEERKRVISFMWNKAEVKVKSEDIKAQGDPEAGEELKKDPNLTQVKTLNMTDEPDFLPPEAGGSKKATEDEIEAAMDCIINTATVMPSVLAGFKEAASAVKEVAATLKDTAGAVKANSGAITSSLTKAGDVVSSTVKVTFNATRLAVFFKGLCDVMNGETWNERWVPMATCALALGLSPDVVVKAGEWLLSIANTILGPIKVHEDVKPQAWEDTWNQSWTAFIEEHAGTLKLIAAGVITILTFYITGSSPITSRVQDYSTSMLNKLRNFAIVGTAIKTLDWLFRWIADMIKTAAVTVADWWSDGQVTAYQMSSHYPEVVSWLKKVAIYETEAQRTALTWNSDVRLELWKRMDEGQILMDKLTSKSGNLYNAISRGMIQLQKAHDRAIMTRSMNPFREDPFHICLTGGAGVGKSAVLSLVLNFVADHVGLPKQHRFYSRGEQDQFWSNYAGQPVVIIDDLFADKKGVSIKELIPMKSNCAWPLNMSWQEEKGRHFMSKIIGSTTNVMFPRPDDMNFPMAIWRRRNILAEVTSASMKKAGEKPSLDDLRFNLLNPANENGEREVISGPLRIQDFMVVCALVAGSYLDEQRKLVYAGLQGAEIKTRDYGDPVELRRTVDSDYAALKTLLSMDCKITANVMLRLSTSLTDQQLTELINNQQYREKLVKSEVFDAVLAERALKLRHNYLIDLFMSQEPECAVAASRGLLADVKMGLYVREDCGKVIPLVHGRKMTEWAYFKVSNHDRITDIVQWTAQGDDLEELLVNNQIDVTIDKANSLKEEASRAIATKERLCENFDRVKDLAMGDRCPTKMLKVANVSEIKSYVDMSFPDASKKKKEVLVRMLSKAYSDAHSPEGVGAARKDIESERFAQLYGSKYDKYWKEVTDEKDTKKKHWIMEFSSEELDDDEAMEAETLYRLMQVSWEQEEIDKMKELMKPRKAEAEDPWIIKFESFWRKKYDKAKAWFEEHPLVLRVIKLAGIMAGAFVGYKLIAYLFPNVWDKICTAFAAMFGWIWRSERAQQVKEYGTKVARKVHGKMKDSLEWVRNLMRSSRDPELQEQANDPEAVEIFAEALTRQVKAAKGLVELQALNVEGKKKHVNPYMIGMQDRLKAEMEMREVDRRPPKEGWGAQGCEDMNATMLRNSKLTTNICRVAWLSAAGKAMAMQGLFVDGRSLLVPYHFFKLCPPGTIFKMQTKNEVTYYDVYQPERAVKLHEIDACVYACSLRVMQFPKLTQHFIPQKELIFTKTPATLNNFVNDLCFIVQPVEASLEVELNYKIDDDPAIAPVRNVEVWAYEARTTPGDCGSVLLAENTRIRSKILGIHICGAVEHNWGASAVITQEALQMALDMLPASTGVQTAGFIPESIVTKEPEKMKVQPHGNFIHIGAVAPTKAVQLPHKTEIEPSRIHDMVREHVTEPSVLTRNDPRNESGNSPLLQAIEKYGKPTIPFSPVDLNYIARDVGNEVLTWTCPMGKRKLTDHEAVFGNDLIEYCDRMNLGASPGYPYTLSRPSGEKGKGYLYDINSEDGIADEEYRVRYRVREKLARMGKRSVSVWTDCLKDERRPLEKIRKGKTRAFMLPPADFVQLCRKYFMSFCVAFYTNRIKSFSAVGIDPYSYDWTRLVRKLRRTSNYGFGGDFHSFDGIFDPDIFERILHIVNRWYRTKSDKDYEPEDDVVRGVLVEEMVHTLHICLDSLYVKCQGNPSGNPLTVIVNTFAHCFYIRLAWMDLARENCPEMADMSSFHKVAAEIYYGDDGLLAVKQPLVPWFNLKTVSEVLALHKIEYTSESKTDELYGVRQVVECTFLKNGFSRLKENKLWLAPISKDTIYELTNWVRKSEDPLAQMRENLECAMSFAFHHGRDFFERFCEDVNRALRARGLREIAGSYEVEMDKFLAKCRA